MLKKIRTARKTNSKCALLLLVAFTVIASTMSTLSLTASAESAKFQPLEVASGYNVDIVATSIHSSSDEHFSKTSSMDSDVFKTVGSSNAACLFDRRYSSEFGYLPENRKIVSKTLQGLYWQMASYTENNALRLFKDDNGKLTFSTLGVYKKVYFLCTAGGLGSGNTAELKATINYTDGTSNVSEFTVYDWWNQDSYATDLYTRLVNGHVDGTYYGAPYFTQCAMDVDSTKLIQSIDLCNSTSGMILCVFGVSGLAAPVSAPTATTATEKTYDSFTANWESVAGADSYRLDVSITQDFSSYVAYNNTDVGNVTSMKVSGLTPGTTYYYRVRALNNDGQSVSSNIISVVLDTPHVHADSLTHHEAETQSCKAPVKGEYWSCSCGKLFSDADAANEISAIPELPALVNAHNWDEGKITANPTVDTEGVKTYTCKICGITKTEPVAKISQTELKLGDSANLSALLVVQFVCAVAAVLALYMKKRIKQ